MIGTKVKRLRVFDSRLLNAKVKIFVYTRLLGFKSEHARVGDDCRNYIRVFK